jgi:hypothetical protein
MKANLRKIIEQLELCKFSCEGGALEHNSAFIELRRVASDFRYIADCLANEWIETGIRRSRICVAQDDIDGEIGERKIYVSIEWGKDNGTLSE